MNWKKIKNILSIGILCVCLVGLISYLLVQNRDAGYAVEVYKVDDTGYGYKIMLNERPLIVQPFVPGIPGKQYFRTSDDARRVGELVLERLESGQLYAVTLEDLNHLEIKLSTD